MSALGALEQALVYPHLASRPPALARAEVAARQCCQVLMVQIGPFPGLQVPGLHKLCLFCDFQGRCCSGCPTRSPGKVTRGAVCVFDVHVYMAAVLTVKYVASDVCLAI